MWELQAKEEQADDDDSIKALTAAIVEVRVQSIYTSINVRKKWDFVTSKQVDWLGEAPFFATDIWLL